MTAPVAVRDAATVMLLRDGPAGLEVFMLRRNLASEFVAGAYVFPGGGVDDADRHVDLEEVCEGRTDAQASEALGIADHGLAYWVAAIRECFEEAGVLLARTDGGELIRLDEPANTERFTRYRHEVESGAIRLIDVCRREKLRLAVDGIHYFSHWITPEGAPRRYDTRFFVTAAPEDQTPLHDDIETIEHTWVRPADALERHRAGEFDLIFPTIRSLEDLTRFDRAADVLAAAALAADIPEIRPRLHADQHGVRILIPGDEGYDEAVGGVPDGTKWTERPGAPEINRGSGG